MKTFAILAVSGLLAGLLAAGETVKFERDQHVRYRLLPEVDAVVPGETFTVALHILHDEGWHTYWKQPGIAGIPTQIEWVLPKGFKAGPIQWQQPQRTKMAAYTVYGYEGEACLLTDITAPPALPPGKEISMKAKITWMMCAQRCLPSTAEAELKMKSAGNAKVQKEEKKRFDRLRAGFSRGSKAWKIRAERAGEEVTLTLEPGENAGMPDADEVYFFTGDGLIHSDAKQAVTRKENGSLVLRLRVSEFGPENPKRLTGELVLDGREGWERGDSAFSSLQVDVPLSVRGPEATR